ncbi:MAG: response regulator [Azospirillum sp.]|nr:response regulator [Azospirillum sp.]
MTGTSETATERDEEIAFVAETDPLDAGDTPWKVLVVDDEPDVHTMTALILADLRFKGRPAAFLGAYSAAEARIILNEVPDIAVALIDVVMEEDHAGLGLARMIREDIGNREIRIILRTGQPGQAPQRQVVIDYDINDYRAKGGLSADDLFIAVMSALRAYDHIISIESTVAERTRALSQSREALRAILANSPVAVAALRGDGRLVFVNREMAKLIGVSEHHLVGYDFAALFDDRADHARLVRAMLERGPLRDVEMRLRRADGAAFWALMSGDIADFDGEPAYLNWIYDISQRKQTEVRVKEAKDQAERATLAKSAFLATMSHEIRTPMNGVLGMLELLEQSPLQPTQAETVATVRESATGLLRIIDDILDFSKIEAGRLDLEHVPLSITAVVDTVAGMLSPNAWRKQLELVTFVDPEVPPAMLGDPVRLRQILFNLGGNSVKFTERGRIILRVAPIGRQGDRTLLRFSVSDTGIGIDPAIQPGLFEAYVQAGPSTTRRYGGTGLGLSICRRLTEMMGGTIGVESEVGQGATFWFTVPLQPSDGLLNRDGESLIEPEPSLAGLRLLVGSADDLICELLTRYLAAAGADVTAVADGAAFQEAARHALAMRVPYNAAVVDGLLYQGAVIAVREGLNCGIDATPLPAVLLAERPHGGERKRARSGGAPLTVPKPVRRAALIHAVAIATGRVDASEPPPPTVRPAPRCAPAGVRAPSVEAALRDGRLVLVAEDNAINRKVITMQLNMLGFAAEVVDDGFAALAALEKKRYALLLTDCHMPDLDGFELTRRVRETESASGTGRRLPIVAVTANAFEGEAARFRAAGMDDYLCKPLDLTRLLKILNRWLPGGPCDDGAPRAEPGVTQIVGAAGRPAQPIAGPPPAAALPALPVDLSALAVVCGKDDGLIREMLGEFVAVSGRVLADLTGAVERREAVQAKSFAHNLKGSSRIAGARALAELCAALEVACKAADWPTIDRLAVSAATELARVEGFHQSLQTGAAE